MDARTVAAAYAACRAGIGVALIVAPGRLAGAWVGRDAGTIGARVLGAALGARELAIGLGTLRTLRDGYGASTWLRAGAVGDATDLAVTLLARRELPSLGAAGVAAMAAGGAATGAWLQRVVE